MINDEIGDSILWRVYFKLTILFCTMLDDFV